MNLAMELEATLVVRSEDPRSVVDEVAGLNSIHPYGLLPQEDQVIHDRYVDTREGELRERKLALRIRRVDTTLLITLKGPARAAAGAGTERSELETPWSEGALSRVLKELQARGVKGLRPLLDFGDARPLELMRGVGLFVIEDRETHRKVRNIVESIDRPDLALAELAIDFVVYRLRTVEVSHYEIEVEAKVEDGSQVLQDVVEFLTQRFGASLEPWDYGKLATGMAIERLLEGRSAEEVLSANNALRPSAYDELRRILVQGESSG